MGLCAGHPRWGLKQLLSATGYRVYPLRNVAVESDVVCQGQTLAAPKCVSVGLAAVLMKHVVACQVKSQTGVAAGVADTEFVYMYNVGPEEPFNTGQAPAQTEFATPFTSQVCRTGDSL